MTKPVCLKHEEEKFMLSTSVWSCRSCKREYDREYEASKKKFCAGDCGSLVTSKSERCRKCSGFARRKGIVRFIDVRGYSVLCGVYDHPNNIGRGGRIYEHTYVMSQILGRGLLPGEEVHHKNGIRTDNNPSNLELWLKSQPSGARVVDLLEWAHALINQYEGVEIG